MNGAMADPLVKTIRIPKNKSVMIMGRSQYFFRVLMKPHRSVRKSMLFSLPMLPFFLNIFFAPQREY
jgi:hypothetical protein